MRWAIILVASIALLSASGTRAPAQSTTLSQSEIDAFRQRIYDCWTPPAGIDANSNDYVAIRILLRPDGSLAQMPVVVQGLAFPRGPAIADTAKRALLQCQPFTMFKPEDYQAWKDITIDFNPHDVLGSSGYSPGASAPPIDPSQRCQSIPDKLQRDNCFAQAGIPVVDCHHPQNGDDVAFCRQVLGTAAANQNTPQPSGTASPASPSAAQAQPSHSIWPTPSPSTQANPSPKYTANQIAALLDKAAPTEVQSQAPTQAPSTVDYSIRFTLIVVGIAFAAAFIAWPTLRKICAFLFVGGLCLWAVSKMVANNDHLPTQSNINVDESSPLEEGSDVITQIQSDGRTDEEKIQAERSFAEVKQCIFNSLISNIQQGETSETAMRLNATKTCAVLYHAYVATSICPYVADCKDEALSNTIFRKLVDLIMTDMGFK